MEKLEQSLRGLLKGEFSSLTLGFNDAGAPNYMSVKQEEEEGQPFGDWISEEERQIGMDNNSCWTIQYYPNTPIGFYAFKASSLSALLNFVFKHPK